MLKDTHSVPQGAVIEGDICILGAGAAGLSLALELQNTKGKILLIESGDFEYDDATQQLYAGESTGLPYPLSTTRLRYFGGSTNHWTGLCLPLDAIDFEKRDWLPHSGWPFSLQALHPYYVRAHQVLKLKFPRYDLGFWQNKVRGSAWPVNDERLQSKIYQIVHNIRLMDVYKDRIITAPNIDTYLRSNVVEMQTDREGRVTNAARIKTLEGKEFFIKCKAFVLALGGIENPRLLLNSDSVQKTGIGNDHDLVGRFFMEHPHLRNGLIIPTDQSMAKRFYTWSNFLDKKKSRILGFVAPTALHLRRKQLLNAAMEVAPVVEPPGKPEGEEEETPNDAYNDLVTDYLKSLGDMGRAFPMLWRVPRDRQKIRGKKILKRFKLFARTEQAPNPESRVTLNPKRDRLGVRQASLNWQLTELDYRSIYQFYELVGEVFGQNAWGRLWHPYPPASPWKEPMGYGNHHIGTTRMHDNPQEGVVDAQLQVHGNANLFIAGSSVFPTGGSANPTLTIIALAIRLADFLRKEYL